MAVFELSNDSAIEQFANASVKIANEREYAVLGANATITKLISPAPDRMKGKKTIKDTKTNHTLVIEIPIPKDLATREALLMAKTTALVHIPKSGVIKKEVNE